MQIYLPVAEMAVPAEALVFIGVIVGLLSGLFGIGGGFLATPFLMFMGVPSAIAVGTQPSQLIATGTTGLLGHYRRGNVDFKMGGVMLAGGLLGAILGMFLFHLLQHFGQIDLFISLSYILLLGTIGSTMFLETVRSAFLSKEKGKGAGNHGARHSAFFKALPYKMRFPKSRLYVSVFVPVGIGLFGGIMVSVLGIGGGFILIPAMIYILGMPAILVAGTSLFQMVFTAVFSCMLHAFSGQTLDVVLAIVMMLGGVIGAQIGVLLSRKIPPLWGRGVLSLVILSVALRMVFQLFGTPVDVYSLEFRP